MADEKLIQLEADNAKLQAENETLKAENAALKSQVQELEADVADLQAISNEQTTEIKVLSAKAEGAEEVITAEHEGKVYKVLGGAYVPVDGETQKLSAADIAASPEVVAHLVAIESGILKEVK